MLKIYTTKTCPNCEKLKNKMMENDIPFTEEGKIFDPIVEAGFKSVPVLSLSDEVFFEYDGAMEYIERIK